MEEFRNSWSRASDDFEKRQALINDILHITKWGGKQYLKQIVTFQPEIVMSTISRIAHYCQVSNIRCTKSHNLNFSHLVLQLLLCNLLKPGVKMIMKM